MRKRWRRCGREILAREFSFVNYVRTLVELASRDGPKSVGRRAQLQLRAVSARTAQVDHQPDLSASRSAVPGRLLDRQQCRHRLEMLHASGLSYRIITNEANQGTYRQWLRGIREAKGDLIWIAEADDDCAPDLLERLVEPIRAPGCGARVLPVQAD